MDDVERESELMKAKVLELNAAMLEIACQHALTYQDLKTAVLNVAKDGRMMAAEIRSKVEGFKRN